MIVFPTGVRRLVPTKRATGTRLSVLLALLSLVLSGCRYMRTGDPAVLRPTAPGEVHLVDVCKRQCTDSADVVAAGVDGFLIMPWADTTQLVMTAPSFTNPTIWWMTFGDWLLGTRPDTARITRRLNAMPAANASRLARVGALLVGHGHYDHLMDVPPLLPRMPDARVFGSSTVINLLAPVAAAEPRRVSVDSIAARDARHGVTAYDVGPALRVRAMAWEHAPNIGGLTVAPGDQRTPRRTLPRTVFGWKKGAVYAYAVDILQRDGTAGLRLFFHDAAAGPEVQRRAGEIVAGLPSARTTVVMATAANFDQRPLYPDILLAHLAPDHVILGHWDDFFRSSEKPERVVRGIDARELVRRLAPYVGTHWNAPRAGAITRIRW
ncbi:MBL fold metallo-hydrolase [Gemmatimonas sp.]|uniref:MBL fold metallo-hydrolase n=1 Tax=Gemmatimonas sp. TaxID=1962908 RepID=UPI003F7219B8